MSYIANATKLDKLPSDLGSEPVKLVDPRVNEVRLLKEPMDSGIEPLIPNPARESVVSPLKYSMPDGMVPDGLVSVMLVICLRSPNVKVEPIVLLGIWRAISLISHCWLSKSEA